MISKSNKFIKYASIAALAIVALAASLSSNNINLGKNILRGRASEEINGSITFSKPSSTTTYIPNSYYYTSGKTTTGMTVYLRNVCTTSFGNSNVAVMPGSTESPSLDPEITFSLSNSAASVPHFGFQNITSIYAKSDSGTTRTLYVYTSNDGSSWSSAISFGINSSGATCTNVSGAKYLKLGYQGFYTLNIVEFVINYACSSSEPEPSKTVESIEVKTAPKTSYNLGDNFDPARLVITATYDDETTSDISYSGNEDQFDFTPSLSTALTTDDNNVSILYGGKSCNLPITVSSAVTSLSGQYSFTNATQYSTTTVIMDFDNNYYYKDGAISNKLYFTYSIEGSTIVFTLQAKRGGSSSCDYGMFATNYRLFGNTNTDGTTKTGTLSDNFQSITVVINSNSRTFTKA